VTGNRKQTFLLTLLVAVAFTIRFTFWINPGFGAPHATIYDVELYTSFGIQYIESIASLNFTAFTSINPGVPPLGMILTGTAASLLGSHIGHVQAGLLAPITASSLTVVPIYLLLKKRSQKAALIAATAQALDPFLIQYSAAYLDSIGALFTVITVYLIITGRGRRDLAAAAAFASLAALTKFNFLIFPLIFAALLLLQRQVSAKEAAAYAITPVASMVLNPWLWTPKSLQSSIELNTTLNNLPLSALLGPFAIGVPQSLPWYVLTYLGLGAVFWNTLPQITQFVFFTLSIWKALNRKLAPLCKELTAVSAMVVTIFVLPRNYWTYVWAGSIRGEDVLFKQFYPYYFYPVGPFFAILTGALLAQQNDRTVTTCSRLITYPVLLASVLSPFALVMNLAFPYWDFLFTLIYNLSLGRWVVEGLVATSVTTAMLVFAVMFSELIHRRAFCGRRRTPHPPRS